DERAVARGARIGDDDAEERTLLGPCPAQTNRYHDALLNDARGSNSNACFASRIERRLMTAAKHLHRLTAGLLPAAGEPGHPAELFQHLLHLHELLQQTIYFFNRGSAASRNALAAAAVDDVLLAPLVRRHRRDNRFHPREL